MKLGLARHPHDVPRKFVCGTEPPGIPGSDFAKHPAAVRLAEDLDHQIQMTAHHPDTFRKPGLGKQFTPAQVMQCVQENPWIIEITAPDAYAGASGVIEHHPGGLRCGYVAITDYRNTFDGLY